MLEKYDPTLNQENVQLDCSSCFPWGINFASLCRTQGEQRGIISLLALQLSYWKCHITTPNWDGRLWFDKVNHVGLSYY